MNNIDHYLNESLDADFTSVFNKNKKLFSKSLETMLQSKVGNDETVSVDNLEEIELKTKDGNYYISIYFDEPLEWNSETNEIENDGDIEEITIATPDSDMEKVTDKKLYKAIETLLVKGISDFLG